MSGDASAFRGYDKILYDNSIIESSGAATLKLYANDITYMPDSMLAGLVSFCNRTGTKIAIEYYAVSSRAGETGEGIGPPIETYDGFRRLAQFGGKIDYLDIDQALYRAEHQYGWSIDDIADSVAANVAAIKSIFPEVLVHDIEPFPRPHSLEQLGEWFDALEARGVSISAYAPDVQWDDPSWKQSLENLSALLVQKNIKLSLIFNGGNQDSDAGWAAVAEHRLAMVAASTKIEFSTANIQTWQPRPLAVGPANKLGSMANVSSVFKSLYELYRSGAIGNVQISSINLSSPDTIVGLTGEITPISGLSVSLGMSDIIESANIAVVITGGSTTLSAIHRDGTLIGGSGTTQIVLSGSMEDINAALATLTIVETDQVSDLINIEVFDVSGRIADQQVAVSFVPRGLDKITAILPNPTVSLLPASDSGVSGDGITNITRPVVAGTALAGGTVTVRVDDVSVGTVLADGAGAWTYTPAVPLSAEAHSLTVRVTDTVGNTSGWTALPISISTMPPAKPTVALNLHNDTGFPGDGITSLNQPQLVGTAMAGGTVSLRIDGGPAEAIAVKTDGTWSYQPGKPLTLGTHTVSATVADPASNVSPDRAFTFTVSAALQGSEPGQDGLFAEAWYLQQHPEAAASGLTPYAYFMTAGWKNGDDPNPWFSTRYYLNQNQDVADGGINPLFHYGNWGWQEGRNPSVFFDGKAYQTENPASALTNPLLHFIQNSEQGINAGMPPAVKPSAVTLDYLVDVQWYYSLYPEVAAQGLDPYNHYMTVGWQRGYNPNPWFDTNFYLTQNPDIAKAGINPLFHYENWGWKEGRDPSATFSVKGYLAENKDVAAADMDPLLHYIAAGIKEGRQGVAPSDPVLKAPTIDLVPHTDSGVLGDGITNITRPVMSGTALAGGTVTVRVDGVSVGAVLANAAGAWSYTPAVPLSPGKHYLTVSVTDTAGNTSGWTALPISIVTLPPAKPTVSLLPASDSGVLGDGITNITRPVVGGTALAGGTVTVRVDGVSVGTVLADDAGAWTYKPAVPLSAGAHSLTVSVTDTAGNTSAWSALPISIATPSLPNPTVSLLPASDSGMLGDDITNNTRPIVGGTALAGGTVTVRVDEVSVGTVLANGAGAWTYTPAVPLSEGARSLTVSVTDTVGNTSGWTELPISIVTLPPPPPTVVLAPFGDTGFLGDGITSINRPLLVGTAMAGGTVSLRIDGGTAEAIAVKTDGTWSYQPGKPLTLGTHTVSATVADPASNVSPDRTFTFTVSAALQGSEPGQDGLFAEAWYLQQNPEATASGLTPYAYFMTAGWKNGDDPNPWFSTRYYLNQNQDVANAGINPLVHYENWGWKEGRDPSATFSVNGYLATNKDVAAANVDPLLHYIMAGIKEGRRGFAPGDPALKAPTIDLVPHADSGVLGDGITNITRPVVGGTTLAGGTVTVRVNGVSVGTVLADGAGAWTYTPAVPLSEGAHSLTVSVTDAVGNTSGWTALPISVVTLLPAKPTVTLLPASDSGVSDDNITNITRPVESGTTLTGSSGPDGLDGLKDVELLQFSASTTITAESLRSQPDAEELMSFITEGRLSFQVPIPYSGPLDLKYVYPGTDVDDIVSGTKFNDFMNLAGGNDAVHMGPGNDVVDGGGGSNFLSGDAGHDTFYLDGRFLVPVWSCITDWEAGEALTLWGWKAGVSKAAWSENDGLTGFKGATMFADIDGNGVVETAVTWAGMRTSELPMQTEMQVSGIGVLLFG